ncbi:hypothetical protein AB0H28_14470 [Micromonospora sp. NPDC050980]|uniref:hypothetical protein n=1 Tax=Micromonospora sp. NPDC050980 TaxID=3155161 RepID=UPI0033E6DCD0
MTNTEQHSVSPAPIICKTVSINAHYIEFYGWYWGAKADLTISVQFPREGVQHNSFAVGGFEDGDEAVAALVAMCTAVGVVFANPDLEWTMDMADSDPHQYRRNREAMATVMEMAAADHGWTARRVPMLRRDLYSDL